MRTKQPEDMEAQIKRHVSEASEGVSEVQQAFVAEIAQRNAGQLAALAWEHYAVEGRGLLRVELNGLLLETAEGVCHVGLSYLLADTLTRRRARRCPLLSTYDPATQFVLAVAWPEDLTSFFLIETAPPPYFAAALRYRQN